MGRVISKAEFVAAQRRKAALEDRSTAKVTLVQLPWDMEDATEMDRSRPVYARSDDFRHDVRFQ